MGKGRRKSNEPAAAFGVDDALYAAWIAYAFDRPVTARGWYFDLDLGEGFEADPVETVGLIGRTFARSGVDLAGFSDAQVYYGLNFMTNAILSQADAFGDAAVPVERRIAAIRAFDSLYAECFAPRCQPCLGHLGEGDDNPLNTLAYMLWDTTPIEYLNRHLPPVMAAIVDVWATALGSPNDACIEGALHGLGHAARAHPALVHPVIDRFLASTRDASPHPRRGATALRPIRAELRAYAGWARTGSIL